MDKYSKFLVIMVAGCLLLAACGGITQGMVTPTVGGTGENVIVITHDMNGKSVSLKVGDTFEIQIPTIPTAGYNWEAEDLDATILLQVGDPVFKADSNLTGAGGIVTLKFKVVGTGTTPLNLIYVRPSENGVPSLYTDSFGVTVEVK
jgi:predicted secreted protein